MIFRRALLRELTLTSIAIFVVLLAITFSTQIVRLLGAAAAGAMQTDGVLALLGFRALYYFPVLLSVTIVLATLLTLSRAYRDSEMVVWFSSGQSLSAWLRPILWFSAPIVFTIALLSVALSPWANNKSEEYMRVLESREDVNAILPGIFKELARGERLLIFFVERFNPLDKSIRNFFAQSTDGNRIVTMVAETAHLREDDNGDRYFVLNKGRRYEGTPNSADYRVVDFEKHGLRVEASPVRAGPKSLKALSTRELFEKAQPAHIAELYWRLGLPLNTLLLVLLAIPLAYVNPRIGRSANLLATILLWFIAYNFLSVTQAWIAQGRLAWPVAMILLHGSMSAVILIFFYVRLAAYAPLLRWRRNS